MCNFDSICLPIYNIINYTFTQRIYYLYIYNSIHYDATVGYIVTIKLPTTVYILYTFLVKYIIGILIFLIDVVRMGLK